MTPTPKSARFHLLITIVIAMALAGFATSCAQPAQNPVNQPGPSAFGTPPPPPVGSPADATDFDVQLHFGDGASVKPTSYSYSRCPYTDGGARCLGDDDTWRSQDNAQFDWVQTAQFAISPGATPKFITVTDSKGSPCVRVLQRDQFKDIKTDGSEPYDQIAFPDKPIHLTLIPFDCTSFVFDSHRALAVWISPHAWTAPPADAIRCDLKTGPAYGQQDWSDGDCIINKPQWRFSRDGSAIRYTGTIWDMLDKPQKTIFVDLDEGLSLYAPLTNEYVEYGVHDNVSGGCAAVVDALNSGQAPPAGNCTVGTAGVYTKPTDKQIVVTGFGRISGGGVLSATRNNPPQLPSGSNLPADLTSVSSAAQYHVWSSLLGLSSSSGESNAIDISSITVAWGPKRNQSAVNLNTIAMRELESAKFWDNNKPVKMFDVKMPSNWIDAADGPEVGGQGSDISYVYLLVADDSIKIAAQNVKYQEATILQGNAGGVVNLGSYGFNRGVNGSYVQGIWVHRITHNLHAGGQPQDDGRGAIITSRTCPMSPLDHFDGSGYGSNLEGVTVENLMVPKLGSSQGINSVTRPIAIGIQGGTGQGRDTFCNFGNMATKGFQMGGDSRHNALVFNNFQIYPNPLSTSLLYNDPPKNVPVNWGYIVFYTGANPLGAGDRVDASQAVTLHDDNANAYFVCGADPVKCFTANGMPGQINLDYSPGFPTDGNIVFPYGG